MSVQGVYIIKNTKTCDGYVGASVKVYERWAAHKRSLDKDKHYNPLLQAAWNHYGPENFILEVIEAVPLREQLVTREQYHIDELHPAYNLRRTAIRIPVRTIWEGPTDAERYWKKVERQPEGCWVWKGSTNSRGYGRVKIAGKTYPAHRLAFVLTHGDIPDGMFVCHSCDNPPCVNPAHLFVGTAADNVRDRHAKGRCAKGDRNGARVHPERWARGERHWTKHHPTYMKGENHIKARLSSVDVADIRLRYAEGGVTQVQLAKEYGVAQTTVSAVLRRETWNYEPL